MRDALGQIDSRHWIVTEASCGVPAGFVTDLRSGPGVQDLRYAAAYLVHDWAYATGRTTRKRADKKLLAMLIALGMERRQALAEYEAVRAFGWVPWYCNRVRRWWRPGWYMDYAALRDARRDV